MIYVVADDLTGAAECAGIGHRFGLRSEVHATATAISQADLISIDTNTRGCSEDVASVRVVEICSNLSLGTGDWIFKKVDSVLRGPVLAEISALAKRLAVDRVLLIPANPSLGRFVRAGHYYLSDKPIHETEFSADPEHPISSSNVVEMLGQDVNSTEVSLRSPGSALPQEGIVVGDASDAADLTGWAKELDSTTLPAGGAEFLAAILAAQSNNANKKKAHCLDFSDFEKTLFVSGSSSSYGRQFSQLLEKNLIPVHRAPRKLQDPDISPESLIKEWAKMASNSLRSNRMARVCIDLPVQQNPKLSRHLISSLIKSVEKILELTRINHLCVEGGETLSTLVRRLAWSSFTVQSELTPGVVSLQPCTPGAPLVTAKPGSYEWPNEIRGLIGNSRF